MLRIQNSNISVFLRRGVHWNFVCGFAKKRKSPGQKAGQGQDFKDLDRNNAFFKRFRQEYKIDDGSIFQAFTEGNFLKYVNETQRILPFLFDTRLLLKFRKEFENSGDYQQRIRDWYGSPLDERIRATKANLGKYTGTDMPAKKFSYLKPFYELYLEFLTLNHPDELRISKDLSQLTDLRKPHEWFPEARSMKREITYHHGPTNSGKTFAALAELKGASSGIYCAPLRLLAWEVQEKLLEEGVRCNLITGQEKVLFVNNSHTSCTVETANLLEKYEVAVIDEIQMIGDPQRGSAWTNALLGLQSKSIHVCGDERCLGLIENICRLTGDKLIERKYSRMSKLLFKPQPFNLKSDLMKGDCVISFSVKNVLALKRKINFLRGHQNNKCAVVYGKLPPENRKDQARRFNDPDSDLIYLIATNAIGMGLNLQIKRIIFHTLNKKGFKGNIEKIEDAEIRQIAGRAGRSKENGEVFCMRQEDVRHVRRALKNVNESLSKASVEETKNPQERAANSEEEAQSSVSEEETIFSEEEATSPQGKSQLGRTLTANESSIERAGIFPSFVQLEKFSKDLNSLEQRSSSLSSVFKKFVSIALIEGIYFIQHSEDFCEAADLIEDLGLELKDQFIFASAPLAGNPKWRKEKKIFREFAKNFVSFNCVRIPNFIGDRRDGFGYDENKLSILEEEHHILDTYLWLGQKYESAFPDIQKAKEMKDRISYLISEILENI